MVVPPLPWRIDTKEIKNEKMVTVLCGGYLTDSVDIYYRYRLLSSKNPDLFKLRMTVKSEEDYLPVISQLQNVAFQIDETVISFIERNRTTMIEIGLLSDNAFIGVDSDSFVSAFMRELLKTNSTSKEFNYKNLNYEVMVESQKASQEQIV